jgi:hypothetical protein
MDENEARTALEEAGFKIMDEVTVDLSDVKEERTVVPPTNDVRLRIDKVTPSQNKDNTYRWLKIMFKIEDGIQVGEEIKYKGKPIFTNFCYYADPKAYTKEHFTKRQHLVGITQLLKAIGVDVAGVKFNDALVSEMKGKVVVGNIRQKRNKFVTKSGEQVDEPENIVTNLKAEKVGSNV